MSIDDQGEVGPDIDTDIHAAAPQPPTTEPTTEPTPAPRRRVSRRAATRPAGPPGSEPEPTADSSAEPAVAADEPLPDPVEPDQDPPQEKPARSRARRAAAPVFQAPDLTPAPRRHRAASRPAGPPVHVEDDAPAPPLPSPPHLPPADDTAEHLDDAALDDATLVESPDDAGAPLVDAPLDESPDDATPDDADNDSEEDDDGPAAEEGRARRSRRRRGGRGRRRRASEEGDDADEPTDDGDDEPAASVDGALDADSALPADAGSSDEADETDQGDQDERSEDGEDAPEGSSSRRRRRRRRSGRASSGTASAEAETDAEGVSDDAPVTGRSRSRTRRTSEVSDDVTAIRGSTRLEAKRQRRRDGRDGGRRRASITEAEFLARRESVERTMVVRSDSGKAQVAVLEDGVLVEHYVARKQHSSMIGNVHLGRVQNVLPSMEAAFVDIGRGRNAVLYAGEVDWDAAGLSGQAKRIESALKPGDAVLVQVTKDPIGHKGSRLTSQISLPGRYLVYVPNGSMTGISRKLPDTERSRLKSILKAVVPEDAGVIVRTAAEGASETELRRDVERLTAQWAEISRRAKQVSPPTLLHGEPDLVVKVVRDVFNEDFTRLVVIGDEAASTVQEYVDAVAPDLSGRVQRWDGPGDAFGFYRIDEQISKALERKVWLPSGGSLVIDRTEAMTVVDVNTGRFTGAGGNLEETVTKNNLEAAEEIVRQLRLRDIGGIIVVDFIDMVLESNRDLVLRRLVECLGRDRTKHQVAEVTSLGLVQMTRKRVGQGLIEAFSEPCEACAGRGVVVHPELLVASSPAPRTHVAAAARPAVPAPAAAAPAVPTPAVPATAVPAPAVPAPAGPVASPATIPPPAAAAAPEVRSREDAARDAVREAMREVASASRHHAPRPADDTGAGEPAGDDRTDPDRTDPDRTDPDRTDPDRSDAARAVAALIGEALAARDAHEAGEVREDGQDGEDGGGHGALGSSSEDGRPSEVSPG